MRALVAFLIISLSTHEILKANSLFENPNSKDKPTDISGRNIYQSLVLGYVGGHFGVFAQQTVEVESPLKAPFRDDFGTPTFADVNMSLSYQSLRFHGYKVGGSFWLNGKIFERKVDDFSKIKNIFLLNNLYVDFYNQFEYFRIRAGRFSVDEEWITNAIEGLSVDYDGLRYLSFNFTWAFRDAYVQPHFVSSFRRNYKVIGVLFARASIFPPGLPLELKSYIYAAPGVFFSPGIKASLNLPLTMELSLKTSANLISYVQSDTTYGKKADNGFGAILSGGLGYAGIELGGGVSIMNKPGADRIDAFGQHTGFERPVGVFYGDSIMAMAYSAYSNRFVDVSIYGRAGKVKGANVKSVEGTIKSAPLDDLEGLELGLTTIYMSNKTKNSQRVIGYFGGKNYLMFRGFAKYAF